MEATDALDVAMNKGSFARGGRSCVAIGAGSASIAASGSATFTFTIDEPCVLDRLILQGPDLTEIKVTEFKIGGDSLISSAHVPATLFAADSVVNPFLGHRADSNTKITVTLANLDGSNAAVCTVGISTR